MDKDWPLIAYLSKAKAIKPSNEIQNHKSKKAFKFNFVLISQNTNLWKTSFGKNFIPIVMPCHAIKRESFILFSDGK